MGYQGFCRDDTILLYVYEHFLVHSNWNLFSAFIIILKCFYFKDLIIILGLEMHEYLDLKESNRKSKSNNQNLFHYLAIIEWPLRPLVHDSPYRLTKDSHKQYIED